MATALANLARIEQESMADAIAPSPPVDFEQWAVDNIAFSERESQFAGPYNPELFPYFSEIYRALSPEDACRIVTVMGGAQIGKTVMATVFTLGSLDLDPADFLYTHPQTDNAKRWSRLKLKAMLRQSTRLSELFPEKNRDGADSLLFKERADGRGSLTISGANSPASLSQVSMSRQVQDDLAKWETNAAGDPEDQADSRSGGFQFAKIFKISTPLVAPGCRITTNYALGSQERFFVPCPQCSHEQSLEIENFLPSVTQDAPEKAHFTCISCGFPIEEHHRLAMLRKGRWVARNEKAKAEHRSFHIWVAYSRLQGFAYIARRWLAACGKPDKEKVFYNDVAGKAYEVRGEAPPWEDLRNRAAAGGHARGALPNWAVLVTVGVDVNGGWLAWQAVAWSRDGRRSVIDYALIDGAIDQKTTHAKLDAVLASSWRHPSGRMIGVDLLAIDGNSWTEDVWDWAKRWPVSRVIMVRGVDGDDRPLLMRVRRERNRRTGKPLRYSSRFYNFATSILKWSLYRNLPAADPLSVGFIGLPTGMSDEYFQELTAERRAKKTNKSGFETYGWVKDEGVRNEALDTMLQAEAAAIKFGLRDLPPAAWDRLYAERATPIVDRQIGLEDFLAEHAVHAPTLPTPPQTLLRPPAATPSPSPAASPAVNATVNPLTKPRRSLGDLASGLSNRN